MIVSGTEIAVILGVVLGLILLNALFVSAEFSLVTLRFTRFGSSAAVRARQREKFVGLLTHLGPTLKVIRLGVTTSTIALGAVLAVTSVKLLERGGVSINSWEAVGVLCLCFLFGVAMTFVVGELVPRALAMQYPVKTLGASTWAVSAFRIISAPFLTVLDSISARLLRAFSIDSSIDLNLLDVEAQIRSVVSGVEELPPFAESLLNNVLEMRKRVAQDILLPRNQIVFLDLHDSAAENIVLARKTGHTRFPLVEGDLDHCVGLIHIKDVFRSNQDFQRLDLRKLRRDVMRIPDDEPLENVLQRMLRVRVHFALVVDEFGGTLGALTLENVLEELVGDILDEFDKEEALIRPGPDGVYFVDGLAPLHDVNEELGIELVNEEVSTFGGYITDELGTMPKANEPFQLGPIEVVVTNMNERRIMLTRAKVIGNRNEADQGAD